MKHLMIMLINIYQKLPLSMHNACRFTPTCSNYAIEAINMYGAIYGSFLSIKRIIRCNPLGKTGFDPVPEIRRRL